MPERWAGTYGGKPVSFPVLEEVARELLLKAGDLKVWLFEGEMGSGKTSLIKAICKELGVRDSTSSPTFSIVNDYKTNQGNDVFHFDFYRINKESEAFDLGVEEYFESGNYCFVEWPEKIPSLFPLNYLRVRISPDSATTRKIDYMVQ